MRFLAVLLVLAALTWTSSAQEIFAGGCPQQSVVQNFDLDRYLGKWYEIKKYFAIFELGGKCITAEYSKNANGNVKVVNTQRNILTNSQSSAEGEAVLVNPNSGEAKLSVSFFPFGAMNLGTGNYWVLDTDYDSYAIVWSCTFDTGLTNKQILWILMRDQIPDPQLLLYVESLIRNRGLNTSRLSRTEQNTCQ